MRPVRAAFLHEADSAGRPRPKIDGHIRAKKDNFIVGARQRRVQESLRVEDRQLRIHEHVLHDFHAGLGRLGAVRMPAHAVEDHHQRGLFCHHNSCAILVVGAVSKSGNLGVFNLHGGCGLQTLHMTMAGCYTV